MTLLKNPTTGVWEADIKDRAIGRLHLSLRTTVQKAALPRHDALEALIRDGQADLVDLLRRRRLRIEAVEACRREGRAWETLRRVVDPWPSVDDAAEQYVRWLETNPNKHGDTAATARKQLGHFQAFAGMPGLPRLGELRLDDVTHEHTQHFQEWCVGRYQPNTVSAYVARVGTLFRWIQRREEQRARAAKRAPRLLHVPIDPETQHRKRTSRERYLTPAEADRMLAATPDALRFPVLAGLLGGLRVSEMLHLRPSFDVDLTHGLLIVQEKELPHGGVWRPKTGKRREVPIAPDLRPVLEHHLARYASETWVVPGLVEPTRPYNKARFGTAFARVVRAAELTPGRTGDGVTFHTLRHTFASWLVSRGADLYTVATQIGDTLKMVETTYGHLAPERRRAAVEKLTGVLAIPSPLGEI